MQVRDTSRSLLAGDPQCAPSCVALGQAIVDVIRALHQDATWTPLINDTIKVTALTQFAPVLLPVDKSLYQFVMIPLWTQDVC